MPSSTLAQRSLGTNQPTNEGLESRIKSDRRPFATGWDGYESGTKENTWRFVLDVTIPYHYGVPHMKFSTVPQRGLRVKRGRTPGSMARVLRVVYLTYTICINYPSSVFMVLFIHTKKTIMNVFWYAAFFLTHIVELIYFPLRYKQHEHPSQLHSSTFSVMIIITGAVLSPVSPFPCTSKVQNSLHTTVQAPIIPSYQFIENFHSTREVGWHWARDS